MSYRKVLKFGLRHFIGNIRYQRFFELLLEFSLKGMHIGGGKGFETSGEKFVLEYVAKKFQRINEIRKRATNP